MSARQRSLSESLGGTQPKAFAIATSRIFVCCTFHKRRSPFMLAKSRGILPQNAQRAEKPENKGVDKTAIRRDTFRVRCPAFRRKPPVKTGQKNSIRRNSDGNVCRDAVEIRSMPQYCYRYHITASPKCQLLLRFPFRFLLFQ